MADAKQDEKKTDEAKKDFGITVKKSDDFSEWYQQAIIKSDFADYTAVSGCIVYRPDSYRVWEKVVSIADSRLKDLGIKNCYFPLFIPEKLLMKEATHLEGFSPEVAWVTQAGDTKLDEKLAIRPTSETIMYDSYSKWIRSWRDLPLRLAQWNNVVRWEFKNPVPFLRGREFLWVEGHTVFATKKEAEDECQDIIKIWEDVMKDYFALAFITGKKSKNETFAGAEYSISLESVLPNGKAIQGPDFHHDGQIFSKAYDIKFLNDSGELEFAYQNTWAISTRQIGIMFMIHGDDKGLVIPPRIAPLHIVIVPILFDDTMDDVLAKCRELKQELSKHKYHEFNYEVNIDERPYKPGFKFNHWELKGVPLRIEIGPKDLENSQVIMVRRDTKEKFVVKMKDVVQKSKEILDDIQSNLYEKSERSLKESIAEANNIDDFRKFIDEKKIVYAAHCTNPDCESTIKDLTGAKTLNSPLKNNPDVTGKRCFCCQSPAKAYFFFGKSY